MGRKSALSEEQWVEVGKRLLEGETPEAISADLTSQGSKISPASIRGHFERKGQSTKTVQQMAGDVFKAEQAVKAAEEGMRATHRALQTMPAAAQVATMTLVQRMRSISDSLAAAADLSAKSSHRLAALANDQLQKVDDAAPEKSAAALANHAGLQKAANEAAKLPTNLIAAAGNRDLMQRVVGEDEPTEDDDVMTPERKLDAARRMAFILAEAKHTMENT